MHRHRDGNEWSFREQNLKGKGRSEKVAGDLWRRDTHRWAAMRVESFQQLLAVKFFRKRKCGPEMGRGLPKFSQPVRSQAGTAFRSSRLIWV